MERNQTRNWALKLLLIPALIAIVYGVSIDAPFVYDDRIHIVENAEVTSFRSLVDIASIHRLFDHPFGLAARPLLFLTYGLNYAAFGLNPAAFRLTNDAIHTANSFLVFLIVFELGRAALWPKQRRVQAALLAGLLFAVHPLLTESVTYIAGRSASLCATFYFAGIYSVLLAGRGRARRKALLLVLALGCTMAGWLVKQDAITLPLAGIALIWLTWSTVESGRVRWVASAVLAGSVLLILILEIQPLKTVSDFTQKNEILTAAGFEETPKFWNYLWTSVREWTAYYFWRLFVPFRLDVDPEIALASGPSLAALGSLVCLLGLAGAMFWLRKREPVMSAGMALILISPLTAYCLFPLADVIAEHRAYITVLGAVTLVSALIVRLRRPLVLSSVLISAFVWQARERNGVWNDEVLLWQDAKRQAPDKLRPHFNLAGLYRTRGDLESAIAEYNWILHRRPEHSAALTNLASIYLDRNDLPKAEALLTPSLSRHTRFAPAYLTLAIVRIRQGRFKEAEGLLYRATELNPEQPMIHHNLGDIFVNEGQLGKAITEYVTELQSNPNSLPTHLNLAKTFEMAGLREKSIQHYRIIQRAEPGNSDVRDALIRLQ